MKTHQKITLLLSLLLFVSCLKNKEYSIEGRLMYGCGSPAANENITLYQHYSMFQAKKTLNRTVKTDTEGYFKLIYKRKEANNLDITLADAGSLMRGIRPYDDQKLGIAYYNPSFSVILKLEADSSYTDQDTLIVPNYNKMFSDEYLKISGPFEDMIIDTVYNYPFMWSVNHSSSLIENKANLSYQINSDGKSTIFKVLVPEFCNDSFHEGVIKL